MDLDNLSAAQRRQLFDQQGTGGVDLVAQQLVEMKAKTGYSTGGSSVSSTYSASTNKFTFPVQVHYISIYSTVDCNFYFNAESDVDASNQLAIVSTSHFIAGGERLNFGLPEMPISRVDFKSLGATATVRLSAFVKCTSFNEASY